MVGGPKLDLMYKYNKSRYTWYYPPTGGRLGCDPRMVDMWTMVSGGAGAGRVGSFVRIQKPSLGCKSITLSGAPGPGWSGAACWLQEVVKLRNCAAL